MLDRPRSRRLATARPILVAAWLSLACGPVRGDEAEVYRRLEAMPRERRAALAENLAEFDRLDAGEKASIRRLDRELSRRDQIDQARYLALMRRYHLWLNGLTEEQRQSLRAAGSPEARLALARKIREKSARDEPEGPKLSGLRLGELGQIGPYEMAFLLQAWNSLTPERRKDLATLRGGKLLAALRAEADRAKIAPLPRPPELDRIGRTRIEADPALKSLVGAIDQPAEGPDASPKRPSQPLAEFLYFEDPEHRPRPVDGDHLQRFQASCPPWLLAMTDPLAPDDARAYMTILYRLIYPFPREMPAKAPASNTPGTAKPTPRPGTAPRTGTPVPL
ncbi:hypothetical protein TA3x_000780 [Tundrisphaera sp. TA3]|uniref:hypothetical protein n=1 Tax=Tundrisphaera sp. TA3 TaxID=3435775 RepID=UPI003EBD7F2F